jgi:hypothetical protein
MRYINIFKLISVFNLNHLYVKLTLIINRIKIYKSEVKLMKIAKILIC